MTLCEWLRQRYLRRKHIIDAIGELEKKVNPYKIADLIVYDDLVPCWNEPIDQYWETAGKPIGERTMNEVYAICVNCNEQSLVKLPNWNELPPECPKCGRLMDPHRKPLSPKQILIISITMLIIGLALSFLWSAFIHVILWG